MLVGGGGREKLSRLPLFSAIYQAVVRGCSWRNFTIALDWAQIVCLRQISDSWPLHSLFCFGHARSSKKSALHLDIGLPLSIIKAMQCSKMLSEL